MAKHYLYTNNNIENVGTALIDYFDAGVTVHVSTTTNLIFTCAAISDKVIRIYIASSQLFATYGDAFDGTSDVTNSVIFGGSSTSGTVSSMDVVIGDTFLLINAFSSIQGSRIFVIGQLNTDAFAVFAASTSGYLTDNYGKMTIDNSTFYVKGIIYDIKTSNNKMIKHDLILYDPVSGLPLTTTFKGISAVSRSFGSLNNHKGSGFFITTSANFMHDSEQIPPLLVEGITN